VENGRNRDKRGHCPPEDESHFDGESGQTEIGAEPRKTPPDERRAEDAKQPTCGGDHPEPETAACGWRSFLGPETNAELRAGCEIGGDVDRYSPQRAQNILRRCNGYCATGASREMLAEPCFVGRTQPFDDGFGKKTLRAFVHIFVHTAPSVMAVFNAARPR
jgi:hypothetical protein